jgi:hypothetical protein
MYGNNKILALNYEVFTGVNMKVKVFEGSMAWEAVVLPLNYARAGLTIANRDCLSQGSPLPQGPGGTKAAKPAA